MDAILVPIISKLVSHEISFASLLPAKVASHMFHDELPRAQLQNVQAFRPSEWLQGLPEHLDSVEHI